MSRSGQTLLERFPAFSLTVHVGGGRGPLHRDRALSTFKEHHRTLLAVLAEAETLVRHQEPERAKKLALIRWQLTRDLRCYQLFKHLEILDPMIAASTPARGQLARAMKERCCAIGEAFESHVRRWSSGSIGHDWHGYEQESVKLIGRLRRHFDRERQELDQLLAGVEEIRENHSLFSSVLIEARGK